MQHGCKQLIGVLVGLVVLVAGIFVWNAPSLHDMRRSIAFWTCSSHARQAIRQKHIQPALVDFCQEEQVTLATGTTLPLVRLAYGPPHEIDYEYIGLFVDNDHTLIDLPSGGEIGINNGMWGHPPLNEWREWCGGVRVDNQVAVGKRQSQYGWLMTVHSLSCTYEYYPNRDPSTLLHRRDYHAMGEIFVYEDATGQDVWDLSQLQVTSKDRPPGT